MHEDERWIDLESRLAYQDRTIEQQGESLLEQERRLEHLEQALRRLEKRMGSESGEGADSP